MPSLLSTFASARELRSRDADHPPNSSTTLVLHCSRDERDLLPAIVARYDAEGELKSASRFRASEGAREGTITDAKLTVSGGTYAIDAAPQSAAHVEECRSPSMRYAESRSQQVVGVAIYPARLTSRPPASTLSVTAASTPPPDYV